ncbi:hypothetical protein [Nocardiopsis ansamitocini]|uniref:Uncharacterized protein n=1 Tax=Nocardiopsis ansamitocini TaxID=1670832 RepID=A0A9W6PA55_9ACTN|nr:hypothetical protein [Nocardiopsis ansamitocini]GLU49839.1 hypothetical protein Nans01_41900 [Nocardiopsis ansamitocini]
MHLETLHHSLGRLVVASAKLESSLRRGLATLFMVYYHNGSILFEGQSIEWMVSNTKAVLKEPPARPEHERAIKILNEIQELNNKRNRLVHGEWTKKCEFACDGDVPGSKYCMCIIRPRNALPDERIFYVTRSRYRKTAETHQVAIRDIDELVQRMAEVESEILSALDACSI